MSTYQILCSFSIHRATLLNNVSNPKCMNWSIVIPSAFPFSFICKSVYLTLSHSFHTPLNHNKSTFLADWTDECCSPCSHFSHLQLVVLSLFQDLRVFFHPLQVDSQPVINTNQSREIHTTYTPASALLTHQRHMSHPPFNLFMQLISSVVQSMFSVQAQLVDTTSHDHTLSLVMCHGFQKLYPT